MCPAYWIMRLGALWYARPDRISWIPSTFETVQSGEARLHFLSPSRTLSHSIPSIFSIAQDKKALSAPRVLESRVDRNCSSRATTSSGRRRVGAVNRRPLRVSLPKRCRRWHPPR